MRLKVSLGFAGFDLILCYAVSNVHDAIKGLGTSHLIMTDLA